MAELAAGLLFSFVAPFEETEELDDSLKGLAVHTNFDCEEGLAATNPLVRETDERERLLSRNDWILANVSPGTYRKEFRISGFCCRSNTYISSG